MAENQVPLALCEIESLILLRRARPSGLRRIASSSEQRSSPICTRMGDKLRPGAQGGVQNSPDLLESREKEMVMSSYRPWKVPFASVPVLMCVGIAGVL